MRWRSLASACCMGVAVGIVTPILWRAAIGGFLAGIAFGLIWTEPPSREREAPK